MSPTQCLFAKIALRAFQLFCLLFVLSGLANVNEMIVAVEASWKGTISIADLCWKILPVTGPLIPGLCSIAGAAWILRQVKPSTQELSEPWMKNPMWAAKHIRLSNRGLFWGLAIGFLFYCGIAVPFAIATAKTPFMVFFGLIGLFLLLVVRVFWRNRKWNISELRMAVVPGVIGGPFSGVAILQQSFPQGTAFDVCLKCQQTKTYRPTHGSGNSSSTTETIWSSTISIDKPLPPDGPSRTLIPFSFAIPFECEPTNDSSLNSSTTTRWSLVVNQKGKVGFGGAVFAVPIFRTSESRRDFTLDEELIAPFEQEVDLEALLARLHMKREPLPGGGKRLTFGTWNGQLAFAVVLLSLVCTSGIIACFWFISNLYGAAFAAIIPTVLMLIGIYALLDMLLWRGSIDVDQNELRCESGWRGFRKTLVASKLEKPDLVSEFDYRKENGEWYRVAISVPHIETDGSSSFDSKLILVKQLDGRAEADAMAQWLRREASIPEVHELGLTPNE